MTCRRWLRSMRTTIGRRARPRSVNSPSCSSSVRTNSTAKSSSQSFSGKRSGRLDSRRDSCSTLSMMWLTRLECVWMISVSRLSSSVRPGRFPQQLGRVTHGAHRVPNFVRNTGAQAAE